MHILNLNDLDLGGAYVLLPYLIVQFDGNPFTKVTSKVFIQDLLLKTICYIFMYALRRSLSVI